MPLPAALTDLRRRLENIGATLRNLLPALHSRPPLTARPIRGSLLSIEQLEQRARVLAGEQEVARREGAMRSLQAALDRNERLLQQAYRILAEDARQRLPVTPAAEWLLDNMHVVIDQIREIRQDLPAGYYAQLPKLARGPQRALPRVYALALELIEHSDGRIDLEHLIRFVLAYQSVTPLTMGELWAIPIMLRIGLVENLGRLATLTLDARQLRLDGDRWATRLLAQEDGAGVERNPALQELARRYPQLPLPFAVQIIRRLRSHDGDLDVGAVVTWLERNPALPYSSTEELIHAEHQRQAANQVSVANTITSMRALNAIDWADWFDRVSLVEQVLRQDPARAYAQSTFATRDRYRHQVEVLARRTGLSEDDVARRLLARAGQALHSGGSLREGHVGYYLVDRGRAAFAAELGYRPTPGEAMRQAALRHPAPLYLGALAGATAAIVAAGLRLASAESRACPERSRRELRTESRAAVLGFRLSVLALTAIPASALAKELVNRAVTSLLPPRVLPRLDLRAGIPAELRTMVVVPTLLLTPESVGTQLDSMEVLYLANEDPHLHFALLSDFADALEPTRPEDDTLLALASERVRALNARYGADRFLLLHRRRVWNERQGRWMGWERKRGKLEEFNRLLAGDEDTTFTTMIGDLSVLPLVRYVITLDSDTQLPRDAAQAMIGTLAHPLNHAVVDPRTRRVVEGYGILQPRVGIDLPSAIKSRFARIFSGNIGVDPYTTAVSDVYMDLFAEGIFAGKGIYDPAAMRAALHDRFPDNTLLSHDLIEGSYARVGLLSDVELLDGYPTTYVAYAARQHRWVRGDWQIAGWLLPWVPRASGGATANVLPLMARYKIFDNLRRSLVPPATLGLLLAGWFWLPGRPGVWTAFALAHYAAPLLLDILDVRFWILDWREWLNLKSKIQHLTLPAVRFLLNLALLPDQAWVNLDAIVRTLYRMLISRRNLLEWETAAQAQRRLTSSAGLLLRRMLPSLGVGAAAGLLRADRLPGAWPAALPVAASWISSPALAAWLDRPYLPPPQPASDDDRLLLRRLARSTWAFFERFVNTDGNYLAPDNFQETPNPVVAYRTSPTNIGLQLLADLAAYDLGYIGLLELTERTERVFATMSRLERYHGHLLNWFDTQTLRPLPPAYVSTVDSGNLAGYLIVLRQGYRALRDRPLAGPWICTGLQDTLALVEQHLQSGAGLAREQLAELAALLAAPPATLGGYRTLLREFAERAARVYAPGPASEWLAALLRQARGFLTDLDTLIADCGLQIADFADVPPPSLADLLRHVHGLPAQTTADHPAGNGQPSTFQPATSQSATCNLQPANLQSSIFNLISRHDAIIASAEEQVIGMDFRFLYDSRRRIFAIGYNVSEGRLDNAFYDLLASESRLASFIAIAKGDVPQEHWFHMGRTITPATPVPTLIAWSGTMFEYLMPLLVMRNYPETLFDATYRGAVARQIAYGRQCKVPWGVSESAFNARDLSMNYQYRAFGVPGLGLQSGLANDLVVAPYATLLALPIQPAAAMANLRALIEQGMFGQYGLYEAVDFTKDRLPPGAASAIIRSFMVHHQGMSLLAIDNYLNDQVMQQRFHAEPMVQATELLLQEKIPLSPPLRLPDETAAARVVTISSAPTTRQFTTPNTAVPYAHLLSNGSYMVLLTNAGGGASSFKDQAVTRWRSDSTRDCWGSFIYVRDARSGAVWSPAYQPLRPASQSYRVIYALEKVEYQQRVAGIDTRLEVTVSPEDNAEIRRVSLTNLTTRPRELEVTSYAEIVLAPPLADAAHPAFSNLFVETEFLEQQEALLASRRPRSADAERLWAVHAIAVRGRSIGEVQYETDRAAFVGRGRTLANPRALHEPLTGSAGAVLDPVFSLRRRLRIVPGGTVQVIFTTAVAPTREQAIDLASRYRDPIAGARAFEMAWTQNQVELRHLNISAEDAHRFQRLASFALYADPLRRARPEVLARNRKGQPGLWAYGISGDYPIILARVAAGDELGLVQELLQAYEYWRLKGLLIDVVILNEDASGYRQGRQEQILALLRSNRAERWLNQRGGVFVLRADVMPEADQVLLQTVARVVLSSRRGDLAQHLRRRATDVASSAAPARRAEPGPLQELVSAGLAPLPPLELRSRNAYGGFTPDGREYVIDLQPGRQTPAPWINVVANPDFGFIVSERGAGYTWAVNSRENRLTPWSNDPVADPAGEALYLRDEERGLLWSPTPYPAGAGYFRIRHGFGYSRFEHARHEIGSDLCLFVPPADPVKIFRLRLYNRSSRARRIAATLYVEWVLGVLREQMAPYVITEIDQERAALLARNPYNHEFGARVAFIAASSREVTITADRGEFIGRNGDPGQPAALDARGDSGAGLSGRAGAGLDPCGAIRCHIELGPGEQRELIFLLGQGEDAAAAHRLIDSYRGSAGAAAAFEQASARWRDMLETVQVRTPQPEMDLLLNGWLLYQTLACRIWARSAFYQSGGAYGFRDQLQDVMALVHAAPELAREHILRAAARQFTEGDVQHWWHPPVGRGIRTSFSDDYLWLPFVTARYVAATGDRAILDEMAPFLEGRPLKPGEAEYYDLPEISGEQASLYEHCARALAYGLRRMSPRGLPLMGAGDWNDGMNMVGHEGRGESVWVGWFLLANLGDFAALAEARGDGGRAARWRAEFRRLQLALEEHTWDGGWYLRAFYDDGTPLGTALGDECRIDSLPQSWAVISGAGDPARARQALAAVDAQLVDGEAGLIKLFAPPFDRGDHNPGYIKGYVPGVRENGGQYTHAAIWVIWAWAQLGEGARATALFDLINPVRHSQADADRYKVEPYTIAADVYAVPPHTGRGGWTWYTGSASWLYRLGVEMILGLRLEGGAPGGPALTLAPCIPPAWPGYEVFYRYGGSCYHIVVDNPASAPAKVVELTVDGEAVAGGRIPLRDDGATHAVRVVLGAAVPVEQL